MSLELTDGGVIPNSGGWNCSDFNTRGGGGGGGGKEGLRPQHWQRQKPELKTHSFTANSHLLWDFLLPFNLGHS